MSNRSAFIRQSKRKRLSVFQKCNELRVLTLWEVEAVLEASSKSKFKLISVKTQLYLFLSRTNGGTHGQGHAVPAVLDQVDDLAVVEGGDLHVVHGQDPVSHLQPAAPLCRRS